jgi:hypothetical protein
LHVLAYNLTRVMNIIGTKPLIAAIRAWYERPHAPSRAPEQPKRSNGDHSGFAPLKAHQNGAPSRLAVIIRRAVLCTLPPIVFTRPRPEADLREGV